MFPARPSADRLVCACGCTRDKHRTTRGGQAGACDGCATCRGYEWSHTLPREASTEAPPPRRRPPDDLRAFTSLEHEMDWLGWTEPDPHAMAPDSFTLSA